MILSMVALPGVRVGGQKWDFLRTLAKSSQRLYVRAVRTVKYNVSRQFFKGGKK